MERELREALREIKTDVTTIRETQIQHSIKLARLETDRAWVFRIAGTISVVVSLIIGGMAILLRG